MNIVSIPDNLEGVVPESRAQAALRVMRQVVEGDLTHQDLRRIRHPAHRAYAAVAWLLLHPEGILDENLYVLGSFHRVMSKITGQNESRAANHTTSAGISTSESPRMPNVPPVRVTTVKPALTGDHQVLYLTMRLIPPPGLELPAPRDHRLVQLVENLRTAKLPDAIDLACLRVHAHLG